MKSSNRSMLLIVIMLLTFTLTGCAGVYRATFDPQKDDGGMSFTSTDARLFGPTTSPTELARAYQIKKEADAYADWLKNAEKEATMSGAAAIGLEGVVFNNSGDYVNMIITGTGGFSRSYYLKPNQIVPDNLPPGRYTAIAYRGSVPSNNTWTFPVRPGEQKVFMDKRVFWYAFYQP